MKIKDVRLCGPVHTAVRQGDLSDSIIMIEFDSQNVFLHNKKLFVSKASRRSLQSFLMSKIIIISLYS